MTKWAEKRRNRFFNVRVTDSGYDYIATRAAAHSITSSEVIRTAIRMAAGNPGGFEKMLAAVAEEERQAREERVR